jgi:hypothetical protein
MYIFKALFEDFGALGISFPPLGGLRGAVTIYLLILANKLKEVPYKWVRFI